MKIELKNFKHYDRLSEETLCFVGNIWVNGIKCGYAENTGKGGCTNYHHEGTEQSRQLLKQAEVYCLGLPPSEWENNGKKYSFKMNLENFIDEIVGELVKKKEKDAIAKKLNKEMQKAILIGIDNGVDITYHTISFKLPLRDMWENYPDHFKLTLKNKLEKYADKGYRLLNTNIPQQFLN